MTLVEISDKTDYSRSTLTWPKFKRPYEGMGVTTEGVTGVIAKGYPATELADKIRREVQSRSDPDFLGYLTLFKRRFAVTDGYVAGIFNPNGRHINDVDIQKVAAARVTKGAWLYGAQSSPPPLNNAILHRPYMIDECWVGRDHRVIIPFHWIKSFLQKYIVQIADPFQWTEVPINDLDRTGPTVEVGGEL
jgi:hypothetical protein